MTFSNPENLDRGLCSDADDEKIPFSGVRWSCGFHRNKEQEALSDKCRIDQDRSCAGVLVARLTLAVLCLLFLPIRPLRIQLTSDSPSGGMRQEFPGR